MKFESEYRKYQKNVWETVVCKMSAILFMPQSRCVTKWHRLSCLHFINRPQHDIRIVIASLQTIVIMTCLSWQNYQHTTIVILSLIKAEIHTVGCRYNAVQYNMTFHSALQWRMHFINQIAHKSHPIHPPYGRTICGFWRKLNQCWLILLLIWLLRTPFNAI